MRKSHNICSVVGARPQFIKLDRSLNQKVIHSGQHHDYRMSQIFFKELKLKKPDVNLNLKTSDTGKILDAVRKEFKKERPKIVLVYGDTNTTLAAALAAAYENIPVAHVESGLRSHRMDMPEEVNRVLTDRLATYRFIHAEYAEENLRKEGIRDGVYIVGDVMFDALNPFLPIKPGKNSKKYGLLTIHRQENADSKERLARIFAGIEKSAHKFVFPVHPRTAKSVKKWKLSYPYNVRVIEPVGYKKMLRLEADASVIVTDSGGVTREAFWFAVPCVTLRRETEWIETLNGCNVLVDDDPDLIAEAIHRKRVLRDREFPKYGAWKRIKEVLKDYL